jgi:transposase-like protein
VANYQVQKKQKVTSKSAWSAALLAILAEADLPEVRLAEAVGVVPVILYRWIRGLRPATAANFRRIGKELAALLHAPAVERYLSALALRDGLLEPGESEVNRARRAILLMLADLRGYLIDGSGPSLSSALDRAAGSSGLDILKLGFELTALQEKAVFNGLRGHASRKPLAEEKIHLLARAGLDITLLLRRDPVVTTSLVRDRFQLAVERQLQEHASELFPEARSRLIDGILGAYENAAKDNANQRDLSREVQGILALAGHPKGSKRGSKK